MNKKSFQIKLSTLKRFYDYYISIFRVNINKLNIELWLCFSMINSQVCYNTQNIHK